MLQTESCVMDAKTLAMSEYLFATHRPDVHLGLLFLGWSLHGSGKLAEYVDA